MKNKPDVSEQMDSDIERLSRRMEKNMCVGEPEDSIAVSCFMCGDLVGLKNARERRGRFLCKKC